MTARAARSLAAVLLAVAAVAAVGLVVVAVRDLRDPRPPVWYAGTGARSTMLRATSADVADALSHTWSSWDAGVAKAETTMTPSLRAQYLASTAGDRAAFVSGRVTVQATVVGAALVSAHRRSADVLLFVDQVTTSVGNRNQRTTTSRLLVTVQGGPGHWLLSAMRVI